MSLLAELAIITIVGGIVSLDTTACWQVMISQPLVSCAILGCLLGNMEMGMTMGIIMQIPWLLEMPVGGTRNSEGNLGSLIAAGMAIHFVNHSITTPNIAIVFSVLWGLIVSWLGWKFVESMRKSNAKLAYMAEKAAESTNFARIAWLNLAGIVYAFTIGAVVMITSYLLGVLVYSKFVAYVPEFFEYPFGYAKIGLLALAAGTMISMFLTRKNIIYFVGGLLITIILIFNF